MAYLIPTLYLTLSNNLYLKQYNTILHDLNESKFSELNTEFRKHKLGKVIFVPFVFTQFYSWNIFVLFQEGLDSTWFYDIVCP